jgi:hypothetical protein
MNNIDKILNKIISRKLMVFVIAYVLYLPLSIVNWFFVKDKWGYFKSSAVNIDKFGNREFRTLFNKVLISNKGYRFGDIGETISSVLGKNQLTGTLTRFGRAIVWILDKIENDHAIKSIDKMTIFVKN